MIDGEPESYTEAAAMLGIRLCTGCEAYTLGNQHKRGTVRYDETGQLLVHWQERAVNVMGLKRFLMLAAEALDGPYDQYPEWEREYRRATRATDLAHVLHKRIPRRHFEIERARLRFLLHDVAEWRKRHWTTDTWSTYRRAIRWAYRTPTASVES